MQYIVPCFFIRDRKKKQLFPFYNYLYQRGKKNGKSCKGEKIYFLKFKSNHKGYHTTGYSSRKLRSLPCVSEMVSVQ